MRPRFSILRATILFAIAASLACSQLTNVVINTPLLASKTSAV